MLNPSCCRWRCHARHITLRIEDQTRLGAPFHALRRAGGCTRWGHRRRRRGAGWFATEQAVRDCRWMTQPNQRKICSALPRYPVTSAAPLLCVRAAQLRGGQTMRAGHDSRRAQRTRLRPHLRLGLQWRWQRKILSTRPRARMNSAAWAVVWAVVQRSARPLRRAACRPWRLRTRLRLARACRATRLRLRAKRRWLRCRLPGWHGSPRRRRASCREGAASARCSSATPPATSRS